jgi:hypothetical protein
MRSVWGDAAFLWNPGDGSTSSFDMVTGLGRGNRFTQGTAVTHDGRRGRSYGSNIGDVFGMVYDPKVDDISFMMVGRLPSGTGVVWCGAALRTDLDQFLSVATNQTIGGSLRLDGSSTAGANDWAAVTSSNSGTGFQVMIVTCEVTATNQGTITLYINSTTATGSDTWNGTSPCDLDTIGIGVLPDSTPSYSGTGNEVYAAALWPRLLTSSDIGRIVADPFGYLETAQRKHMHHSLASLSLAPIKGT